MFEGDREREKGACFCFLCEIMHPSNLPAAAHEKQEANGQKSPGNGEHGSNKIVLSCSFLPFSKSCLLGQAGRSGRQADWIYVEQLKHRNINTEKKKPQKTLAPEERFMSKHSALSPVQT